MALSTEAWADAYRRAWEAADEEGVVELFTEDAEYRSLIYDEPHRGHEGIRSYWRDVTSGQSDVTVRMGRPFVDGERVVVEFWTAMRSGGQPVTLAGCLLLDFAPDGRCRRLREYWNFAEETRQPPAVWGS